MLMISCHLYICNVSMLCWCSSVYIFKSLFVSCELIPASLATFFSSVAGRFAMGNINSIINESQYLLS